MFPIWQTALYTMYTGQATGDSGAGAAASRSPSTSLWSRALSTEVNPDGITGGYGFFDDFTAFEGAAANVASLQRASESGSWTVFTANVTGSTLAQSTTALGGSIVANIPASNGDTCEQYFSHGSGAVDAVVDDSAGKRIIYEARFKVVTLATGQATFYGFSSAAIATGNLTASTGVPLSTADFLGFSQIAGTLKFGWQKGSATAFGTGSATPASSTALVSSGSTPWSTTIVAGTSYKVGFVYDPVSIPSRRIVVCVNGVEVGTVPAASLGSWDTGHSTYTGSAAFPHQVKMTAVGMVRGTAAAAKTIETDWMGCWQAG